MQIEFITFQELYNYSVTFYVSPLTKLRFRVMPYYAGEMLKNTEICRN